MNLDLLEETLGKATPGAWHGMIRFPKREPVWVTAFGPPDANVAECPKAENAHAIVAMRDAMPFLIRLARACVALDAARENFAKNPTPGNRSLYKLATYAYTDAIDDVVGR